MKRIIIPLACAVVFLIATKDIRAGGFTKAGRTAFQFVKIGVGARQTALGEAGIASIRDANSVFWNPAGVTGIGAKEASFSYSTWFADMHIVSGVVGIRWQDVGVFGLSVSSLPYGDIPEATIPTVGGSSDTRTGNFFTGHDLVAGLTFAREFTDKLSIGVTAKFLQEKLYSFTVNSYAFDVGTNYEIGYNGLRIAMSAQNFGPSVKWLTVSDRDEGYDIPLVFRIGVSANIIATGDGFLDLGSSNRVMVSIDAVHPNDFGDRFHVGAEYWFNDMLALRGGYRFNYDEGNASFGFGVKQNVGGLALRADYSFVSYTYLVSPHRFTLSLDF